MTNSYYQKRKERLGKEAYERSRSSWGKAKEEKRPKKDIKI